LFPGPFFVCDPADAPVLAEIDLLPVMVYKAALRFCNQSAVVAAVSGNPARPPIAGSARGIKIMKLIIWTVSALLAIGGAPALAAGNAAAGKTKVAACAACHGGDGNSANPQWPKLAGQPEAYIVKQLQDFKSGARKDPLMSSQVAALSQADMRDIGAFFESQKPQAGAAAGAALAKQGERLYRGGNAKFGVSACMSCHGPSGHGIPPRFPRVSGQHAAYTTKQMLDFKAGTRTNDGDIMTRIAFRMSEAEIRAVSEYMAGLH